MWQTWEKKVLMEEKKHGKSKTGWWSRIKSKTGETKNMMAVSIEEQTRKTLQTYFEMPRIQSFSVRRIDLRIYNNASHHMFVCLYNSHRIAFACTQF